MKLTVLLIFILAVNVPAYTQTDIPAKVVSKNDLLNMLPAVAMQNPVGGGEFGFISAGLSLQNKTRLGANVDGSAAIYVGLGEPRKYIGAGINVNIYGLSNKIGELPWGAGSLNFHINKLLLKDKLLLDVGIENAHFWKRDLSNHYISYDKSYYFSASYTARRENKETTSSFSYFSITAGLGNGYYRTDNNYRKKGRHGFDPFFSIATPVIKRTNLIMEWNGYDVGAGVSSIPIKNFPLMVSFEVTDLVYAVPRLVGTVLIPVRLLQLKGRKYVSPYPIHLKALRPVRTL